MTQISIHLSPSHQDLSLQNFQIKTLNMTTITRLLQVVSSLFLVHAFYSAYEIHQFAKHHNVNREVTLPKDVSRFLIPI